MMRTIFIAVAFIITALAYPMNISAYYYDDDSLAAYSEQANYADSIMEYVDNNNEKHIQVDENPYKFKPTQLIVPAALIGFGVIGLESDWLKYQNNEIRDELQESIDSKLTFDDIAQYTPAIALYGLSLCGIKCRHSYIDRTILLGTAYALMGLSVTSLKTITKVERPDGSSRNSFPSGHTATSFMGAELLRREYWDVSPWIGVAGYAVAAGTGFFRMYNNRHWFTDVIAGAGIGILSVQAAYWLYPTITKTFFSKRYKCNVYLSPRITSQEKGITCSITF
ncbi:MAG: phosphatase PAP2 family protein [Prevotellaceae bacterium]|nr:phosphatase PAP2 family protein [Prevotellaceae bacterium]